MKHTKTPWWRSRTALALFVLLGIAGYSLWTEHKARIVSILVWIVLIAGLLLNGYLHGRHGHGDDNGPGK